MGVSSVIDTKQEAPAWAKLERELLDKQTDACVEFFGALHPPARSLLLLHFVLCPDRFPRLRLRPRCRLLRERFGSLLRAARPAEHYFDVETGYGKWIPRFGGNDGPDDAAENGLNWTILFALGAPPIILELWKRGYEGHLKQYTEAKTVEVPMGREGMYYRDFHVMFDFFHHTVYIYLTIQPPTT